MKALEYYHKAHFLKSEDLLVEELIGKAMEDLTNTDVNPLQKTFFAESAQNLTAWRLIID